MILDKDETILKEIKHKNYLPLRQEDWARFLFIPFMIMGLHLFFNKNVLLGLIFIIPSLIILYNLITRWINILNTQYFLTTKRLIIYDTKFNKIKHSFYYTNFPKMKFRENAYNYGFIIIGELEELIEGPNTPFRFPMRTGMNMNDHQIVIDNIPNVRIEYDLIIEKIKTLHNNV